MNTHVQELGLRTTDGVTVADRPPVPVLLVDDDQDKRFILGRLLAPLGYRIVEADSGLSALRYVLAQDFAVILMDVQMPEMDGLETAALIRKRRQSEQTPIILTTASTSAELSESSLYHHSATSFMFAPIDPDQLRATVSTFGNLFAKAQELAERARALQRAPDALAAMRHEIRAPAKGILAMAELLLDTELDARQRSYTETVRDSGSTLLAIVNDILGFEDRPPHGGAAVPVSL